MSGNKLKAELWDNMQYYFREYNDASMRCILYFDGILDLEILKLSIKSVVEKFPIINSRFVASPIKSYWKLCPDFDIADFFTFSEVAADEWKTTAEKFALVEVNPVKRPQMAAAVFRKVENGKESDCFAVRFSHMVADGSGFNLFLKSLTDTYNNKLKNPRAACRFGMGNRDYKQFYPYLSHDEREKAKKMTGYRYEKNERLQLPLETYRKNDERFERKLFNYKVGGFHKIRAFCKENGFTFNDVILSVYLTSVMKRLKIEEGQTLAVDCILNLRRYMASDAEIGFCNLVSKVKVGIGNDLGGSLIDTCKAVHAFMEKSKDNLGGLGGLTLLNLMDKIFPFAIGKVLIKIFYQNPLIGLSNIGKVDKKIVGFGGLNVVDIVMTGTVKYTPYMLLSLITYEDSIYFAIAAACTKEDGELLNGLLTDVGREIEKIRDAEIS
ncbi:MAG: condensation domain-containing protein [Clostridiales bacterium]|jgi:NRPS condensation-like uncharacterized protein|nr:condensation domain-containing protein [Clostridiales bacterium]